MDYLNQKTVNKTISFEGIGLHTGKISKVAIKPAPANHGIVFLRVDVEHKNNLIPAKVENVSSAVLCTSLKNEVGVEVSTVEHLLAAFYFTGIDNALVEINGSEIPIMDGSAKDFVELINASGINVQQEKIKFLFVNKKIVIED